MSATPGQIGKQPRTETFDALTDGRRRSVLSILDDASPLPERRLATLIAAFERGKPPTALDDGTVRSVRTDLQHVQLPALIDADLVERGDNGVTVTATGRRVLGERWFRTLVETGTQECDDVFDCLASERRRIVLDVLRVHDGPMAKPDLARAVAEREADAGATDDVLASLYHCHLPKLADAGLVERDGEGVAYRGYPDLPIADVLRLIEPGRQ